MTLLICFSEHVIFFFLLKQCIFSPPQIEIMELIVLLVGASLSVVLCFWFSKAKGSKSGWCCSRNVSFCACKTWLCSVSVNIRDETSLVRLCCGFLYGVALGCVYQVVVTSSLHLWHEEKKEAKLFFFTSACLSAAAGALWALPRFSVHIVFCLWFCTRPVFQSACTMLAWFVLFVFFPFLTLNVRYKTRHRKQNCSKKVETF